MRDDEQPDADVAEQETAVTEHQARTPRREVDEGSEADRQEQSIAMPLDEDDRPA